MANPYLAREDAPFRDEIWTILDNAMVTAAKQQLAGRRLLPLEGPYGLGLKSIPLQDREADGLITSSTLPVALIREPFKMGMRDLASYEAGGPLLDTRPVETAARACARREDQVIFYGGAGVPGLMTVEGTQELQLLDWDEVGTAAGAVMQAVTLLDKAGFHGPYSLALAPERYNLLFRRYPQGQQSELGHIQTMVTDGICKAPILQTGGILLASGKDYTSLVLGQDMALGFIGPAGDKIEFAIFESLAVRIRYPQAMCKLRQ
ncbi:MAG: bacteriocin family protein [Anaerolineae bacterium]|nr:bacteriocin family protein [Anaerolineae bacterium]